MPPPDLEEIYDEATLAGIGVHREPVAPAVVAPAPVRPPDGGDQGSAIRALRRGIGGSALVVGLVGGLREVFQPDPDSEIELVVERREPFADRPVSFLFVPGDPRASRIILRPWLTDRST